MPRCPACERDWERTELHPNGLCGNCHYMYCIALIPKEEPMSYEIAILARHLTDKKGNRYKPTGFFRIPAKQEHFINLNGEVESFPHDTYGVDVGPRIIVERIVTYRKPTEEDCGKACEIRNNAQALTPWIKDVYEYVAYAPLNPEGHFIVRDTRSHAYYPVHHCRIQVE